jgi:hypothetical protein
LVSVQAVTVNANANLDAAIDEMYRVFEPYARPESFLGCGCCISGEPVPDESLFNFANGTVSVVEPGGLAPLRELTAADLLDLAFNLPMMAGDIDVYRHYLPRLLEIGVGEGFETPDFRWLLTHLTNTDHYDGGPWWTWPSHEREVIQRFLVAAWEARLDESCDERLSWDIDDLISALLFLVDDISPFLKSWMTFEQSDAAAQLVEYLDWHTPRPPKTNPWNYPHIDRQPFLDPTDLTSERERENGRRLMYWLTGPELQTALEDALKREEGPDRRADFVECLRLLAGFASMPPVSELERAISRRDLLTLRALLSEGADPNTLDPVIKQPYWRLAFDAGDLEATEVFAHAGADLEVLDNRATDSFTTSHRTHRNDLRKFSISAPASTASTVGASPHCTTRQCTGTYHLRTY